MSENVDWDVKHQIEQAKHKQETTKVTLHCLYIIKFEPVHEISNNVICATSKASDQPAHTSSPIRAFASSLSIL